MAVWELALTSNFKSWKLALFSQDVSDTWERVGFLVPTEQSFSLFIQHIYINYFLYARHSGHKKKKWGIDSKELSG